MKPYQLHRGNNIDLLRAMPDNSVDAIVTDPPYGLSFMGKRWDYDVPSVEVWAECLRVLKPGGYLLAFAGTRTQHRMAVRIEDAGFEIRDMIAWVYGSGFPKSLNVANAIHDAAIGQPQGGAKPGSKNHGKFKGGCSDENEAGRGFGAGPGQFMAEAGEKTERDLVEQARQWQGWGTALKPALEPITVARKPLIGTVAENVLQHGTGALNIDGCRVGTESTRRPLGKPLNGGAYGSDRDDRESLNVVGGSDAGRWPANLIHDGSDEVLAAFPQAMTKSTGGKNSKGGMGKRVLGEYALDRTAQNTGGLGDEGTPARFFYCAKASRADRNAGLPDGGKPAVGTGATMREREDADWEARNGNFHPTVKPTDLMRYLVRLVTPAGGLVLDPFNGSGSTGRGAVLEGFRYIGMDLDADEKGEPLGYLRISEARIEAALASLEKAKAAAIERQPDLFGAAS